ncbi:unnamed protein product [Hymenolepis diminuta]|uniref:Uncharacterized protein n=1 Tax=Hymenolepis diminuta TaxID=6216 RepID=A0A0R3SRB2_HYMDI|nr:unnamed protein product [Hymenolepis diminuta]VUZ43915.1 unnamed protein product [Hymenolepis diminuta]
MQSESHVSFMLRLFLNKNEEAFGRDMIVINPTPDILIPLPIANATQDIDFTDGETDQIIFTDGIDVISETPNIVNIPQHCIPTDVKVKTNFFKDSSTNSDGRDQSEVADNTNVPECAEGILGIL